MTINIEVASGDEDAWDRCIARSPHATPFHQQCGIELLETHSDTTAYPLIGRKGEEPVGVLPVFVHSRGPMTMVDSPPDGLEVYYLGPALSQVDQLKQRKLERRNRSFIEQSVEWINANLDPDVCHIRTVEQYHDHRPFKDGGYAVTPYYTYVVDLDRDSQDLLMAFSSDARSNIRTTDESAYEITVGGMADARVIIRQVADRHAEQGKPYHLTDAFVDQLYRSFPDDQVKPYICRVDGETVGGIVVLEFNDTVYRWQGGTTPSVDLPVNDLLDWRVMTDAMERGCTRYDFVGANTHRINRYKSKFAPDLRTYHGARYRSRRAELLSTVKRAVPTNR